MKTSENDVQHNNFDMGEMNKSQELYSKEGDNSSRFEGRQCRGNTHTIPIYVPSSPPERFLNGFTESIPIRITVLSTLFIKFTP